MNMKPDDMRMLLKLLVAAVGTWAGKVTAEALGVHGAFGALVGSIVGWLIGHELGGAMGLT